MPDSITVSTLIPAPPDVVYEAWLDSDDHAAFTGAKATIDPRVGGRHAAWDDYIAGVTLELLPGAKIVQSWRTTEFPDDAPDSRLEVHLSVAEGGTRLTLLHSNIPEGQGRQVEKGWEEFYFAPMREFFMRKAAARAAAHAAALAGAPPPPPPEPIKPRSRPGSARKPAKAAKPAKAGKPAKPAKSKQPPRAAKKAARPAARKSAARPKPKAKKSAAKRPARKLAVKKKSKR